MIRGHVEDSRGTRVERLRRLQLKARELEHVKIGDFVCQQIERRSPEIAAGDRAPPRSFGHARKERRDGALAVRTRDRRDRRTRFAREQFDVAEDRQAECRGTRDERLAHGYAGRDDDLRCSLQQTSIELAESRFGLGRKLRERCRFGRRLPAVGHRKIDAPRAQETCARQARASEPHDDGATACGVRHGMGGCMFVCHVHRTFNVARPTRTRITEMIQKRTMTFGSAQPLSSK